LVTTNHRLTRQSNEDWVLDDPAHKGKRKKKKNGTLNYAQTRNSKQQGDYYQWNKLWKRLPSREGRKTRDNKVAKQHVGQRSAWERNPK